MRLLELSWCLACMLFEYLSEVSVVAESHAAGYLRHLQRCTAQKLLGFVDTHVCEVVDKVDADVLFKQRAEIGRAEVDRRCYAL